MPIFGACLGQARGQEHGRQSFQRIAPVADEVGHLTLVLAGVNRGRENDGFVSREIEVGRRVRCIDHLGNGTRLPQGRRHVLGNRARVAFACRVDD